MKPKIVHTYSYQDQLKDYMTKLHLTMVPNIKVDLEYTIKKLSVLISKILEIRSKHLPSR